MDWPAAVRLAAAGFNPRAEAELLMVLFSAVAVLGLAFATTLFTEVFGAWLSPDRAAAVDELPRFVAGAALSAVVVPLRSAGRAAATRETLLRAFAAMSLAAAGLAVVEGRGFLTVAGDFLLAFGAALVDAAFVVVALVVVALFVAALFLGGMA